MKSVLNFIIAVVLMQIGFFLLFGSGINVDDMSKNLNNYQNSNIPAYGTEVGLYVIDISAEFLENENYEGIMYDVECYYIAQINDGRFIVIKTSKGSDIDIRIEEYIQKCRDYYFLKRGNRPEILYLDGKIDRVPELNEGDYKALLGAGVNKFMPERRYIRMDVNDIVVNVDYNVAGKSMDSVLEQSIKIMASAANALKKVLGVIVVLIGIVMIISFIREILSGVTYGYDNSKVLVAGDEVFKNIAVMKKDLQSEKEEIDYEDIYDSNDNVNSGKKDKNSRKFEQKKSQATKGFTLKKD
ncbi:MAG: hypothetical protein IJ224_11465 [Lachnospiraceae bacterium]|nr:hypothetical protein [Lachnospiraceae bacterium]